MKKFLAKVQVPPFHSGPAADVQQVADTTPENLNCTCSQIKFLMPLSPLASSQDGTHISYLITSAIPNMCECCERKSIELQYLPTRNYLLSSATLEEKAAEL